MMPAFVWLILVLVLAAPLVYLGGHVGRLRQLVANATSVEWETDPPNHLSQWLALGALAVAWIPFTLAARASDAAFALGTLALRFDGIALLLSALALGLGTLVAIFSGAYLRGEKQTEKFFALLLVMVGVMIGLGAARDLFNLWVWFEALAVASYMLVAFQRDERASLEAGVKYLVQSAAGSVMILLGIALVLAQAGTLDLEELGARLVTADSNLLFAALALFVIGFGVKAALVPLHTWLPDAHAHAPSGISAMLSGVVIEAGLIAMLRVMLPLIPHLQGQGNRVAVLFLVFGAINLLAGNLLALRQTEVKRLLAFSSVAQVGYIVFGLGITFWSGQGVGAQGAFFHLLNHGLMKGLAFLAAGALLFALCAGLPRHAPLTISDLAGAARRYPVIAFAFSIALLGLGGLPPLAGFMSKWQIFVAGVDAGNIWIDVLVVFAALNSVLSLAYYAPLVNAMYRGNVSPLVARGTPVPRAMVVPLVVLAVGVVVVGVAPNVLDWLTQPASAALLHSLGY